MLHFDKVQTIEGVTVYGDDEKDNLFYILPDSPRYRLDENGKPVFKFLKYKTPIDRPVSSTSGAPASTSGTATTTAPVSGAAKPTGTATSTVPTVKKGGFCNFDVEFVVTPEKETAVTDKLNAQRGKNDVKIGKLSFIKGTAKLLITNDRNRLVEQVTSPGTPSLYGKNITCFSMELSEEGAPVFETALQGGGGFVQVAYDLTTWARLHGATVKFSIDSMSTHDLTDQVRASEGSSFWHDGKYDEKINDVLTRNESKFIDITFGALPESAQEKIRDWAHTQFADAVKKKIDIISPIKDERLGNKASGGRDTESLVKILQKEEFKIDQTYNEKTSIEWGIHPNGTLPNITTLPGWNKDETEKYFAKISADDPFFRTLEVRARVNADFTALPIYNVTLVVNYDEPRSFVFTSADTVQRYQRYLKDDQSLKYKYHYETHYKNSKNTYKSPELESDSGDLSIDIDDLGLLVVNVTADASIDFAKVTGVTVVFRYEDKEKGITGIEKTFNLTSANRTYAIREILGKPWSQPYEYQVEYVVDGRRLTIGPQSSKSRDLYIGSPFSETKKYKVVGKDIGLSQSTIETIYVDLLYEEAESKHRVSKSFAVTKSANLEWEVPMIDPAKGKLTYEGTISHKDGRTEDIPRTEWPVNKGVIVIEKPKVVESKLKVTVAQDLIDWDSAAGLKMVTVSLKYDDDEARIHENETLTFKKDNKASQDWEVTIKNPSKRTYQWRAAFYTKAGKKETAWKPDTDTTIYPDFDDVV